MPSQFRPVHDELLRQLVEVRSRAAIARDKAVAAKVRLSIKRLDLASRLMEERCIAEHRQAVARMGDLP